MQDDPEVRSVVAVILGGGQGQRLFPLTLYRSKPAVPIGGKYRLIDLPISNCLHSGIEKICVLTQFNSASLHRHISTTYRFDIFSDGFVEILAAEQTQDNTNWYQGTADAVRQQLRRILSKRVDLCLILSGDHLYRMDYRPFLRAHQENQAEVSIAVKPVTREQAPGLGILKMAADGRIVDFREKPKTAAELDELRLEAPPSGSRDDELYLASMGIYIFDPEVLISLLMNNDKEDFGKHIIPEAIHKLRVFAYPFQGYWEDIGTIGSFYRANLALTEFDPPFDFFHPRAPIYTHPDFLVGARLAHCHLDRAIVEEGCYVEKAVIEHSVLGRRSIIGPGVRMIDTVMMGADYYENAADLARDEGKGVPPIGVGARSTIERAIIDSNARLGEGVVIRNLQGVTHADGPCYYIRDGIVVVAKNAVVPAGTTI
jgi:glucose-1-phosphate adenylyltransferase